MNIRRFFTKPKPKTFKEVQSFLSNIPYINCGGCGIAALAMFDAAVKEGYKPRIHYLYHHFCDDTTQKTNEKYKRKEIDQAASCGHIILKIKGQFQDSKGEFEIDYPWSDGGSVSREHLVNSLIHGGWNECFDREQWLPKIEKYIGYKLLGAK